MRLHRFLRLFIGRIECLWSDFIIALGCLDIKQLFPSIESIFERLRGSFINFLKLRLCDVQFIIENIGPALQSKIINLY